MPKIEEIARLKAPDVFRIENIRKELKISQAFIGKCLGISSGTYSNWVSQQKRIPERWIPEIVEIFTAIFHIQSGNFVINRLAEEERKVDVKKQTEETVPKSDLEVVWDFLQEVKDPKISAIEDNQEKSLRKLVQTYSDEAGTILELFNKEGHDNGTEN